MAKAYPPEELAERAFLITMAGVGLFIALAFVIIFQ